MKNNNKILVFVADDEELYRSIISNRLSWMGIKNIRIFEDGESCIQNLYLKPDIIFLDFELGDMYAPDVLIKIRIHSPMSKVIIVSGQKKTQNLTDCLRLGAYDYIEKNINTMGKVEILVQEILEKSIHPKKKENMLVTLYNWLF